MERKMWGCQNIPRTQKWSLGHLTYVLLSPLHLIISQALESAGFIFLSGGVKAMAHLKVNDIFDAMNNDCHVEAY